MSQETSNLAIQPAPKASALALMAGKFNVEPKKLLETLKNTVFRGATDDELMTLVVVSNEYGLNPLLKEIYAFPAKGGGIVPVVSIDGWIRMMNDHPQFDGIDYEFEHADDGKLVACTSVIYRKDRSKPVRVTEYMVECRRNTEPWKMEHRMLRHKATIQGARVAFGFSGITDEDEAAATPGLARDVTPKAARVVPLNPFTSTPEPQAIETVVVDAETVEPAPDATETEPLDDPVLLDILDLVNDCQDAATLNSLYQQSKESAFQEAHQAIVKRAVDSKSKVLGVKWDAKKGGFV